MRIAAAVSAAALVVALTAGGVAAAPAGAPVLTTPAELAARLAAPDLVILHAGEDADFAAGHIPGARLAKRDALSIAGPAAGGLVLELPPEPELRAQMQALGISDRSRVVVYSGSGEVQAATRLMWTLDAAGLGGRSALLDGGLAGWRAAGRAVETGPAAPPAPAKAALSPLRMQPRLVDADFVSAHLKAPGYKVVDARAGAFYDGLQPGFAAAPAKKGHIPGAVNVPFTSVTGADGRFKSAAELRALFAAAGVKPGDKVAVYCHVGQQATAVQFAARTAGIDAKLYDGSFQDWSKRDLPVEGPAK